MVFAQCRHLDYCLVTTTHVHVQKSYLSYNISLDGEPMGQSVCFNYSGPGFVNVVSNTKEVNRYCYAVKVLCKMRVFFYDFIL